MGLFENNANDEKKIDKKSRRKKETQDSGKDDDRNMLKIIRSHLRRVLVLDPKEKK